MDGFARERASARNKRTVENRMDARDDDRRKTQQRKLEAHPPVNTE